MDSALKIKLPIPGDIFSTLIAALNSLYPGCYLETETRENYVTIWLPEVARGAESTIAALELNPEDFVVTREDNAGVNVTSNANELVFTPPTWLGDLVNNLGLVLSDEQPVAFMDGTDPNGEKFYVRLSKEESQEEALKDKVLRLESKLTELGFDTNLI